MSGMKDIYRYPREAGIQLLIGAARTFVARVENGEVRSRKTYRQLKDALDLIDSPLPEVAE